MGKAGLSPTPCRQLFQVHRSKLKPHPVRYPGQTSVLCVPHRVLLLRVREHTLNRLFSPGIQFLAALCLPQSLRQVKVLLPDMSCQQLLPLLIRPTCLPAWAVPAYTRRTSVCPFSFSVCCRVPQSLPLRADIAVCRLIISVVPRLESALPVLLVRIWQNSVVISPA